MEQWFHCNHCFVIYNKNIEFFLTECAHIFCQRCVESINRKKECTICKKRTNLLLLGQNLEPKVNNYFLTPEEHLKQLIEVIEFQNKHRTALFHQMLRRYHVAKKENMKLIQTNRELTEENRKLQDLIGNTRPPPEPAIRSSTPRPMRGGCPSFNINNGSVMTSTLRGSNCSSIRRGLMNFEMTPDRRADHLAMGNSAGYASRFSNENHLLPSHLRGLSTRDTRSPTMGRPYGRNYI